MFCIFTALAQLLLPACIHQLARLYRNGNFWGELRFDSVFEGFSHLNDIMVTIEKNL